MTCVGYNARKTCNNYLTLKDLLKLFFNSFFLAFIDTLTAQNDGKHEDRQMGDNI